MKVLHILYQSLPSVYGSTIRSRDVLWSQTQAGIEPIVITSPFQRPEEVGASLEVIDGVPHHRTYLGHPGLDPSDVEKSLVTRLRRMLTLRRFSQQVEGLALEVKPDLIHAHAMFYCASAGQRARKRLRVPLVYEVRSRWERNPHLTKSPVTRALLPLIGALESREMKRADHVVAINEGLRDDIVQMGLPRSRTSVVGNAVRFDNSSSRPAPDWGSSGVRFGYVGSVTNLEGLDILLDAWASIADQLPGATLDIFGSGAELPLIRDRAAGLSTATVHGQVHPDRVPEVFRVLDVIVMPRRRNHVSETVTALKPLEAMRWGKLVIVSAVGGMLELVTPGETGLAVQPDSVDDLASALLEVGSATDRERLDEIRRKARAYVEQHRSWRANGRRYLDLYESLVSADHA